MPKWADVILIPLISILLAFIISAIVIWSIGEDPVRALTIMVNGALASTYGWGYTLYYATNFIFTGLAVAVAFHARLFNIGGEGQVQLGGLGVALVALYVPWPHWSLALVAAMLAAALFGAAWAAIPAWLQARRGSHVVITTIMFNYIAFSVLNYVLVNLLRPPRAMDPSSARFPEATNLPKIQDIFAYFDIAAFKHAPVNVTFFLAVAACFLVWALIWRTRIGFEIRAFGQSETAAKYGGISPVKITMIAMLISGALAGLMAVNQVLGGTEKLVLNASEGAGFVGISVALMGRSHPFGVFLAALLFGFLTQGGAELDFRTSIPSQLIIVIQALVILFTGALDNMVRMPLERLFLSLRRRA